MPKVKKNSPDPPSILQKLANIYNWRENLAENIDPYGYEKYMPYNALTGESSQTISPLTRLHNAIILDQPEEGSFKNSGYRTRGGWFKPEELSENPQTSERLDLLNLSLGRDLPLNNIKLQEKFKPTKSTNPDAIYYKSPATEKAIKRLYDPYQLGGTKKALEDLQKAASNQNNRVGGVLGRFTIDEGEDERGKYISYYDSWDLNPLRFNELKELDSSLATSLEKHISKIAGVKPTEIYGRVYLDEFNDGGKIKSNKYRVKKYQNGGSVNHLLKMLKEHEGAPPPMTEERYYNPEIKDVSSGDWKQDFLYKNPWLMDTPIVGDMLKDLAKKVAHQSSDPTRSTSDLDLSPFADSAFGYKTGRGFVESDPLNKQSKSRDTSKGYVGDWDSEGNTPIELLDTYFKDEDERDLPKSIYKPKDDYYEWLPSYSLKGNLDSSFYGLDGDEAMATNFDDFTTIVDGILKRGNKSWGDFIKDKKTIFSEYTNYDLDAASRLLNANLGHHKQGLAWDDELQLPYMSISDAWDFEPTDYAKRWAGEKEGRDRAYIQASLMHRAGNPFKIYDRFYIDPETRDYITDEEIKKRRQALNKNKRGGRIPFKVNKRRKMRVAKK